MYIITGGAIVKILLLEYEYEYFSHFIIYTLYVIVVERG